jgi:hypothetical protein
MPSSGVPFLFRVCGPSMVLLEQTAQRYFSLCGVVGRFLRLLLSAQSARTVFKTTTKYSGWELNDDEGPEEVDRGNRSWS